ncbi:ATP-binding cassette domain-containing protein [Kibdelosporangium persicum]|uniref:Daunorubicin resistance ABC transporter ATP-binding subunit n=1 Tax=Kibdelosporangium persicum TaxID=2698649 RepID=A0ABX2F7Q0_9PSEU|nr:ATP-binding cassette domain-containing protein [Kibdelosporangium persicum]NRN66917.1 Daunorubicin resistance ABC transporter ATP-binding subunit [Kibdelosporangium persicum]
MTSNHFASALTVTGLRKAYGDHVVLDGIDLDIPAGSIFALLGANGAGKTTMVRIMSTLIRADSGELRVGGHDVARDPDAVRALIGVTGQFSAVDHLLTGDENLLLMADLHRLSRRDRRQRVAELLTRFDLVDAAKRTTATYSGGMRRRLDLAMTLVGRPKVIFLDEPTTGLDPRSRRTMWDSIRRLVAEDGVTIFLSTQYLAEADLLADRIAVLDKGKLVAHGTADELKRLVGGGHVTLRFADTGSYDRAARALEVLSRNDDTLTLRISSQGDVKSVRSLLDWLDRDQSDVDDLRIHRPDLDDVFFALTGNPVVDQEPAR